MNATAEMPRYKSHKEVWAFKIAKIDLETEPAGPSSATITPADEGYAPFYVSPEYVAKHNPQPGGYYVRYADGYESWSPAEAFESGYTRIK